MTDDPVTGDVAIDLDAPAPVVCRWFVERFFALAESGRADPGSFYASMATVDDDTLRGPAVGTWEAINLPNQIDHIEPTRARATWVVTKAADDTIMAITRGGR